MHVTRRDPESDFSTRAELYGHVRWKNHQEILCPGCVSSSIQLIWNSWWQSPRCSTDFDARRLRGRWSPVNSHVHKSGGGWLSLATLSSWKSAPADRWRAAAAEGWGVVGNNTLEVVGVKTIFSCWCCEIQRDERIWDAARGKAWHQILMQLSDVLNFSEQSGQTWQRVLRMAKKKVVLFNRESFLQSFAAAGSYLSYRCCFRHLVQVWTFCSGNKESFSAATWVFSLFVSKWPLQNPGSAACRSTVLWNAQDSTATSNTLKSAVVCCCDAQSEPQRVTVVPWSLRRYSIALIALPWPSLAPSLHQAITTYMYIHIMTSLPAVYLQRSNAGALRAHYIMVNTGFKCARLLQGRRDGWTPAAAPTLHSRTCSSPSHRPQK